LVRHNAPHRCDIPSTRNPYDRNIITQLPRSDFCGQRPDTPTDTSSSAAHFQQEVRMRRFQFVRAAFAPEHLEPRRLLASCFPSEIGGYPGAVTATLRPVADTTVRGDLEIRKNDNHGKDYELSVGADRGGISGNYGAADAIRSLVRFDLSAAKPGYQVVEAEMTLVVKGVIDLPDTPITLTVHRLLGSWIEGNGAEREPPPPGAVWVDEAYGVAWTGLDANNQAQPAFASTPSASVTLASLKTGDKVTFDLPKLVQRWIDGTPNYGVVIRAVTPYPYNFYQVFFSSREDVESPSANAPQLRVVLCPEGIADLSETGVLTVRGTDAKDNIELKRVGSQITITRDGEFEEYRAVDVKKVVVLGGSGNDNIKLNTVPAEVFGGDGNDLILGSNGRDILRGESGHDTMVAGEGDDYVEGNAGNDSILGGAGHDHIYAGSGDDRVYGHSGNDTILGEDGHDALWGGTGNDRLDGGAGNDIVTGEGGHDVMFGRTGDDRFYARDFLSDWLDGGSGYDRVQVDLLKDVRLNVEGKL
jgi:Ca2+-binding RTX toxin-like protein